MLKWLAYLSSGFLLAASLHFARPAVSSLERPLQVRGFHVVRESLFALGFLLVVLLLSEPFLAQDTRKEEFSFRLHVPTTGQVVLAGFARNHPNIMNNMILLTLLLFFVLQALIYIACLVKLAEIRRQNVTPRIKLRLLENEDHLFDAGLYLGFVGTIVSLILVSMGVIKFSLMAAYSSTSFGIIFVCVFKIFNLRPARRRLVLESEAEAAGISAPAATPTPRTNAGHAVMNRSILIVICDFLLLSLLTFSTDLSKMAGENEGSAATVKVDVLPKTGDASGKDLAEVMKQALGEEQKNREQLQAELARVREAARQQQEQFDQQPSLQQKQSNLEQQYASAQASIQVLNQKLQSGAAETSMTRQQLAAKRRRKFKNRPTWPPPCGSSSPSSRKTTSCPGPKTATGQPAPDWPKLRNAPPPNKPP